MPNHLPESQVPKHTIPRDLPVTISVGIGSLLLGINFGFNLAHNIEEREQVVATATQSGAAPNEERLQQLEKLIATETIGLGFSLTTLGSIAIGTPLRRKRIKDILSTAEGHETLADKLPKLKDATRGLKKQLYENDNPLFKGRPLRDDAEAEDGRFGLMSIYNNALRCAGFEIALKGDTEQPSAQLVGLLAVAVNLLNHAKNLDNDKKPYPSYYERSKADYEMQLAILNELAPLVKNGEPQPWEDYIATLRQDKSRARLLQELDYAICWAK